MNTTSVAAGRTPQIVSSIAKVHRYYGSGFFFFSGKFLV
jgi:hypothetical protein